MTISDEQFEQVSRLLADRSSREKFVGQVLSARLARAEMGAVSSKGRTSFIFHGEPTEIENVWFGYQDRVLASRKNQGVGNG